MDRKLFQYNIPEHLIPQKLLPPIEKCRLVILVRRRKRLIHCYFEDLIKFLYPGDLLVFNNSAVIPTRMWGVLDYGGQVEVTLVTKIRDDVWEVLIRPEDSLRKNTRVYVGKKKLQIILIKKTKFNGWQVKLHSPCADTGHILDTIAKINVPFYIKRNVMLRDYQTIYATVPGSAQCPTSGLYFTQNFIDTIRDKGIQIGYITLHIGGSILPVMGSNFDNFQLRREYCEVDEETRHKIHQTKKAGNRVIAVGTTVVRTLETVANHDGSASWKKGWTSLTIKCGYTFKIIDAFLTNFHLPGSSQLLLTVAFGGRQNIFEAYKEAVNRKYRFLDFGDKMFIV